MQFTKTHEWVAVEKDVATVGITDYAQKELGDIVYVELPKVGHTVRAEEEIAVLESTKAAVDLYSPLSGEIVAANESLKEFPEKINGSPEQEGWLFKIKVTRPDELKKLLDKKTYLNLIQNS